VDGYVTLKPRSANTTTRKRLDISIELITSCSTLDAQIRLFAVNVCNWNLK